MEIIHKWQHAGINYEMYEDLTVKSDKPETQLKKLDLNEKSFIANGKLYLIENELSTERWIKQQQFQTEIGFGLSYSELRMHMKKIYELSNQNGGRIGDIGRIAYNSVNGIDMMLERQPQILKFCALFMNTVDEDRNTITDEKISTFCEDVRKEGFVLDGFFVFVLSLIKDLAEDYKNLTQNTLKVAEEMLNPQQQKD